MKKISLKGRKADSRFAAQLGAFLKENRDKLRYFAITIDFYLSTNDKPVATMANDMFLNKGFFFCGASLWIGFTLL